MKKIFTAVVALFVASSVSAQVYVGGGFGIGSAKYKNGETTEKNTTYKLLPEIGYRLNDKWAAGLVAGWQGTDNGNKSVTVNPYARYTALHSKYIDVFCDGTVGYGHVNGVGDTYQVGLKPGVAINLNKRLSFVTHVGFIGYNQSSERTDHGKYKSKEWGVDLDSNNITFSILYNL